MAYPDEPARSLTDNPQSSTPAIGAAAIAVASVAAPLLPSRRDAALAGMALIAAFLAALAAYVVIAAPGPWFPDAKALSWKAAELKLTTGTGTLEGNSLVVAANNTADTIIVSLITDFRSSQLLSIVWSVQGVPDGAEVQMLWKSDVTGSRTYQTAVTVESGRLRPVVLANNQAWLGRIQGIALAIRAPLSAPLRFEGVSAKPMGAPQILTERLHEWLAFEPFSGASINTIAGGADWQDLPLPPLVALAVALATLLLWVLHRMRPRFYACNVMSTLAALFALAWFSLDARWIVNLAQQTGTTLAQYGGKSTRDKHLAAEDGGLYAFVEKARAAMPATPARIFVAANEPYFRGRAAYHLYPHNVWLEPSRDLLPHPDWLRAGDWLFVYKRPGVQYNPEKKSLRWDNGAAVSAELKLLEPGGAALFQIH